LKVIIGLGNPGLEYEGTRHNAGFEIIDSINNMTQSPGEKFTVDKTRLAQIRKTAMNNESILLAKPVTYMNDSGKALVQIKRFFKVPLKDFLIIHDDISLPLGKIRLQKEGGAGGQHGVESIIECLGGEKGFNRLKIGIGPDPGGDVRHDYVLQKFSVKERTVLAKVIALATKAAFQWTAYGIDQAMNEFNGLDCR
jgi:peptidyl-tRNA hydrolase, PTH1 family